MFYCGPQNARTFFYGAGGGRNKRIETPAVGQKIIASFQKFQYILGSSDWSQLKARSVNTVDPNGSQSNPTSTVIPNAPNTPYTPYYPSFPATSKTGLRKARRLAKEKELAAEQVSPEQA